jgi:hypothetical protein
MELHSVPEAKPELISARALNWFQPTFPAAGARYVLKKDQPLVLKFRLFIHPDKADEAKLAEGWAAFARPVVATTGEQSPSTNPHP